MLIFARKILDDTMAKYGYSSQQALVITIIEIIIGIVTAIPRTSVFGVLFMTAYLGAAVSAHIRVGEPFILPIILALFAWAGLWLREPRLRELVPLRK